MEKVVFVINVDWYFNLHWLERALFLVRNNYDVYVITKFQNEQLRELLSKKGIKCRSIELNRSSVNVLNELKCSISLYCALSKINPDLIHAVTVKPNIYSGLINRFFWKKPIVYSVTGLGAVFSSNGMKFLLIKKVITAIYRFISSNNSKFIFENGDDFNQFHELGILKENGVVVKGAGVDINTFKPKPFLADNNVLFAARLLKDKGLDTLIESVEILKNKGVDIKLNVAGIIDNDVNDAISIHELEALHNKGTINWLGSRTDMVDLINENNVVCLPTRYGEGVPRILIEGAACGRALVATDMSGCRDIVVDGKNGFLVPPSDSKMLAKKLAILLNDKLLCEEFGRFGRNLVERHYSNELVFSKTISIYRELLKP